MIQTKTDPRTHRRWTLSPDIRINQIQRQRVAAAISQLLRSRSWTTAMKTTETKTIPTVFFVVSWTTAFLKFNLLSDPPIPLSKLTTATYIPSFVFVPHEQVYCPCALLLINISEYFRRSSLSIRRVSRVYAPDTVSGSTVLEEEVVVECLYNRAWPWNQRER